MYGNRLSQEPDREFHNFLHNLSHESDRSLSFDGISFLESTCTCFPSWLLLPSIRILLPRLMFVSSILHVRGFSSQRIDEKTHSCLVCVCVRNIWIDAKLHISGLAASLNNFDSRFQFRRGCRAQWKLHPAKLSACAGSRVWSTLCTCNFERHGKGLSREPQLQWFCFYTVATIWHSLRLFIYFTDMAEG